MFNMLYINIKTIGLEIKSREKIPFMKELMNVHTYGVW